MRKYQKSEESYQKSESFRTEILHKKTPNPGVFLHFVESPPFLLSIRSNDRSGGRPPKAPPFFHLCENSKKDSNRLAHLLRVLYNQVSENLGAGAQEAMSSNENRPY